MKRGLGVPRLECAAVAVGCSDDHGSLLVMEEADLAIEIGRRCCRSILDDAGVVMLVGAEAFAHGRTAPPGRDFARRVAQGETIVYQKLVFVFRIGEEVARRPP